MTVNIMSLDFPAVSQTKLRLWKMSDQTIAPHFEVNDTHLTNVISSASTGQCVDMNHFQSDALLLCLNLL